MGHRRLFSITIGLAAVLSAIATMAPASAEARELHPCTTAAVTTGDADYTVSHRHEASLVRLYCAAFFREPDAEGFEYWSEQWRQFVLIGEQAAYFVDSEEFRQRFGDDLGTTEFLTVLYRHVFLREPDPEGLAYWEDLMTNETPLTRASVLIQFAESAEMVNQIDLPHDLPRLEQDFLVRDNPWGAGIMLGIAQVPHKTVPPLTGLPGSGVFINTTIAPYWNDLVAAARAAGFIIRVGPGGGYRSYDAQVAARKRNGCPDIYISPSDTCRIPTSRPGESNHQSGIALDLDLGGSSRGSLTWLRAHAHEYGFYAFYSEQQPWGDLTAAERERSLVEPWHWSVNGR